MKLVKPTVAILLALCCAACLAACGQATETKIDIVAPTISATFDEVPKFSDAACEDSQNVNGKRFTLTLYDFTRKYNELKRAAGENDLMISGNWRRQGSPVKDNNGVEMQYYYYDDDGVNITATAEIESQKLVNVGCGTTMSYFMAQDGDVPNSEAVLRKAAFVAQAACQLEGNCVSVLQNVFYRTTTESNDSIWFNGYIFSLSTKEDKSNSKNSVMLFRVFPVSDSLKNEWKTVEYTVAAEK